MDGCSDVKLLIILKALIAIGFFVEYYLGKRGSSGLDVALNVVRAMLTLIVLLTIMVVVWINERVNRK